MTEYPGIHAFLPPAPSRVRDLAVTIPLVRELDWSAAHAVSLAGRGTPEALDSAETVIEGLAEKLAVLEAAHKAAQESVAIALGAIREANQAIHGHDIAAAELPVDEPAPADTPAAPEAPAEEPKAPPAPRPRKGS